MKTMSDGSFLKIASVCSVPFTSTLVQNPTNQLPVMENGQGEVNGTNTGMLGLYMLPATSVSSTPGSPTAYVQLPAERIHQIVEGVVDGTPSQPVPVVDSQLNVPPSYVIQGKVNVPGAASSNGVQFVTTTPDIVQQSPSHLILNQPKTEQIGTLLDRLISKNETILKGNDVSAFRPRASAGRPVTPQLPRQTPAILSTVQNPVVSKLNLPPSQSLPQGPAVKNRTVPTDKHMLLRRELTAGQKTRISDMVVRPQTPTKMCSLQPTDESLFSSSLVQIRLKSNPVFGDSSRTRGAICGLVCKAKVKVTQTSALPIDTDLYWCNFCSHKSETKVEFLHHVMSHRFHCLFCNFQAFSRADVIQHCAKSHAAFETEPWSFCSLLNDQLKIAVQESKRTDAPGDAEVEYLGEELKASDYELLDLEMEDEGDTAISPEIQPERKILKKKLVNSKGKPESLTFEEGKESHNENEDQSTDNTPSWNCQYCDFVSQDYKLIQIHCTIMHPTLNKSAKEVKVSSELAMQIRKLDTIRKLHLEKGEKEFLQSTESVNSAKTSPAQSKSRAQSAENGYSAKRPSVQSKAKTQHPADDVEEKSQPSRDVQIYECFHCHGQSLKLKEVASHLQTDHCGEAFIAIDLRAIRLKQARFIVFCPRPKCNFSTRNEKPFMEHIKHCCPRLSKKSSLQSPYVPAWHASVLKSVLFAKKSMRTISRCKKVLPGTGSKLTICRSCGFECAKPNQIRNHMIKYHRNKQPAYTVSHKLGKGFVRRTVYFCPVCPGPQTPSFTYLNEHVRAKHNVTSSKNPSALSILEIIEASSEVMEADPVEEEGAQAETDIKPNAEELESMIEKYLEDETQAKMATLGSSSRHAAVKADVKLKTKGHLPNMYQCKFCKYQCLGLNLMRTHLHQEHDGAPLVASDCGNNTPVYICPKPGCPYCHKDGADWKRHCTQKHGMSNVSVPAELTADELQKYSRFPPMFECLYCENSLTTKTAGLMREHVSRVHAGDMVVMRDVVARRQCLASRLYMCADLSCDFLTRKQTEYSAHMLQHACDPRGGGHAHRGKQNGASLNHPEGAVPMDQCSSDWENPSEVTIEDTTTQDVHRIKLGV